MPHKPLLVIICILFSANTIMPSSISAQRDQSPNLISSRSTTDTSDTYFEVGMSYHANQTPIISIDNITIRSGPVPIHENTSEYSLRLLDDAEELYRIPFELPIRVQVAPPLPGDETGGSIVLQDTNFSVTAPYIPQATRIDIVLDTTTIDSYDLDRMPAVPAHTTHDTLRTQESIEFLPRLPDHYSTIDIAVISNNYASLEMETFRNDASRMATHFFTYDPISSQSEKFVFHTIENTQDLGCHRDSSVDRCILCDSQRIQSAVNASGAPNDFIAVITNDDTYGGCSIGNIVTSYNGFWGPQVFIHELGHSFGSLHDEYTYGTIGGITNSEWSNCYSGNPPSQLWESLLPGAINYNLECMHSNWYRSSPTSLMREINVEYFNEVSKHILNERIQYLTELKPYDINLNGIVNTEDFMLFMNLYQLEIDGYFFDYNNDDMINTLDYSMYLLPG